ncbi:MAG: alpha/beta hydrolase fold domain-containing protein [Gammaproteobacteria bacterium]
MTRDPVDPQIRQFIREVSAAFARFPGFDLGSPVEARRIAEQVRAPWRKGGPAMLSTSERHVPVNGGSLRIRVYDPGPLGIKPALVYLHGGGWTIFSIDTHDRVMREYAAGAAVVVIGVDYPLSPEARFPVALEENVALIRWLADHAEEIGVDPDHIAVGGDSAGANLALATALKLRDSASPADRSLVAALLLNYGAFDTHSSPEAALKFGAKGAMLEHEEMQRFWANYLRDPADAESPLACPLRANVAGLPPTFLTIPPLDLLAEQSVALAAKLHEANVPVRAEIYEGATHSFLEAMSISTLAQRALADASHWLRQTMAARVSAAESL